jgi:hypothetical protein
VLDTALDLAMDKEDAQAEHDDADNGEGQQRRSRRINR